MPLEKSPQYDIIGDIHGRAGALADILARLGYREGPGGYAHPDGRKAIFLGDFIDRGPEQKRALSIVRAMVAAGQAEAVMGNHEFNAICYATPDGKGGHIRPHTPNNAQQHEKFLAAYPFGSPEHREMIAWFRTLPVYLEKDGFRVIHACWDDRSLDALRPWMDAGNRLTDAAYAAYAAREDAVYNGIEILLKAPESPLPPGLSYTDPHGHPRTVARHLWWRDPARPADERLHITVPMTPEQKAQLNAGTRLRDDFMRAAIPTFVGHFGLPPQSRPEHSAHVIVLDYTGQITAYRTDGTESRGLSPARLISCPQ